MQAEISQAAAPSLFWTRVSYLSCIAPLNEEEDSTEKIERWFNDFREVFTMEPTLSIPIDYPMRSRTLLAAYLTCSSYLKIRVKIPNHEYYDHKEIEAFFGPLTIFVSKTQAVTFVRKGLVERVDTIVENVLKSLIAAFPQTDEILRNPDSLYSNNSKDLKLNIEQLTRAKNNLLEIKENAWNYLDPILQCNELFLFKFYEKVKDYNDTLGLQKPIAFPLNVNCSMRGIFQEKIQDHINTLNTGLVVAESHKRKEESTPQEPASTSRRSRTHSWITFPRHRPKPDKNSDRVSPRGHVSSRGLIQEHEKRPENVSTRPKERVPQKSTQKEEELSEAEFARLFESLGDVTLNLSASEEGKAASVERETYSREKEEHRSEIALPRLLKLLGTKSGEKEEDPAEVVLSYFESLADSNLPENRGKEEDPAEKTWAKGKISPRGNNLNVTASEENVVIPTVSISLRESLNNREGTLRRIASHFNHPKENNANSSNGDK